MANKFDKLQHIPIEDYDENDYSILKKVYLDDIYWFYKNNQNAILSVDAYLVEHEYYMNKNGVQKFVIMLIGLLFQIQKDEVDPDLAFGTNYDVNDFETGEYDYLFTPVDLELIKKDVSTIKDYLEKHPELLKD